MLTPDSLVLAYFLLKNRKERRRFARKAKQVQQFQESFQFPLSAKTHFRNWLLGLDLLYSSEQLDRLLAYGDFDTLKEVSHDELRTTVGRLTAYQLTHIINEAEKCCQFLGCPRKATFFSVNADGDRVKLCEEHGC